MWGRELYVESRTQVADGQGPGFAEPHIKSARNGEGPDGWAPGAAPAIRETVFGRDAGHERGDDHVTRASDAMDRGHGIDGDGQREPRIEREAGERRGGKSRERSAGRERAGQESGRPDRELDREPGGAGGSGRESEHEQAAEPKPKTPDVDLGV